MGHKQQGTAGSSLEPWFPLLPRLSSPSPWLSVLGSPGGGGWRLMMTGEPVIGPLAPESKCPSRDQAVEAGPQPGVRAGGPITGHLAPEGEGGVDGTSLLHPDTHLWLHLLPASPPLPTLPIHQNPNTMTRSSYVRPRKEPEEAMALGLATGSGGVSPLRRGAPALGAGPNSATIPRVILGKSELRSISFLHPEPL